MRIFAINGSPRRGRSNTWRIARAFLAGAERAGAEIDTCEAYALDIRPCVGCFGCWLKTPGKCVQSDDMDVVLPRLMASDGVVWSAPLYCFGLPSQAKALLDRTLPMAQGGIIEREDGGMGHPLREGVRLRSAVLLSSGGIGALENNSEALEKQFEILYGDTLSRILCAQGELLGGNSPELRPLLDRYLAKAERAGEHYARTERIPPELEAELREPILPPEIYWRGANEHLTGTER